MRTKQAYALIEILIILLSVPMVFTLCVMMFRVMTSYDYALVTRQNIVGVIQLRRRIMIGSKIEVSDHRISMITENETREFICEFDQLYEINGTIVYLTDIEDCRFVQKGSLIYVEYRYNNQKYHIFLAYDA